MDEQQLVFSFWDEHGVHRDEQGACQCTHCVYCDMPLPKRHEHDHFPWPKAGGGLSTVPACMNCHELKDRTPFEKWPVVSVHG